MKKHQIKIYGMHCSSCEVLIHKEVSKIPGVKYLEISHKTGVLEIIHDESLDKVAVEEAICRCGYTCHPEQSEGSRDSSATPQNDSSNFNHFSLTQENFLSWLKAGSILVILYYLFTLVAETSFFKNAVNLNQSNLSLPLALMVGVVASFSTCLAVVGSVVLGLSASFKNKRILNQVQDDNGWINAILPNLVFQTGRIISFFVLGGLLGLVGTNFRYSPALSSILNIGVAVAIGYLALSMLNLLPPMKSLLASFAPQIATSMNKLENEASYGSTFLLGGLTFFLPCGFTQSMQVLALGQADFFKSGLIMAAFALGTAPVLFGVGILGSSAKKLQDPALVKVIALVLIVFAFFNFNTGLALQGWSLPSLTFAAVNGGNGGDAGASANIQNGKQTLPDGRQVIEMEVNNNGYTPAAFTLKNKVPVEWRINATALNGCNSAIIIPSLGVQKQLQSGLNIINFTPTQVGRLNFSCGMGMIRGYFEVVDPSTPPAGSGQANSIKIGAIPQAQVDQKATQGGSCGGGSGGCGCGANKVR